jgi:hypothetical protein
MVRTGSITSPGRTGTSPRPSSAGRAAGGTRSTRPVRSELAGPAVAAELSMGVDAQPEGSLASLGYVTKGEPCREQALVFRYSRPSDTYYLALTCGFTIRASLRAYKAAGHEHGGSSPSRSILQLDAYSTRTVQVRPATARSRT